MSEPRKAKVPRNLDFSALFGALARIRTGGVPLRRRTLYPTEVLGRTYEIDPTGVTCAEF